MNTQRNFLFLQGPHGPFFAQLAAMLRAAGANVHRVGFNAGDRVFWGRMPNYIPYRGAPADWPDRLQEILHSRAITDIVIYGDTRPIHAQAVAAAKTAGIRVHVFEEGYLRPYWVTYERGGSNGHSELMGLQVADMRQRLAAGTTDIPTPPSHWGDMRQHIFYGALYHWFVMFWNRGYPQFKPHRALPIHREAILYSKRLGLMPFLALSRIYATHKIKKAGYPYHIALLQLEHDASFRAHSSFEDMQAFLTLVIDGFAQGAKAHHHLVFKAHPLENGQSPLRKMIRDLAGAKGIADRVHYVRGGKLAGLLAQARSAVTVNSTAGQQALWRGIPLRAFGTAVYSKPEFVSDQPLPAFFANPTRPDADAYRHYRQFLLQTSQIPGGFYATKGRRQLKRQLVDKMLSDTGPYASTQSPSHATFKVVS
ncbi:capsule biosynthesis protein CapA [Loktanella sp. D2R18]|uniref:capsule biosynthesis protein n=1 Tax=Rhodobacterales TaxID=204455 RepID=UPI000DEBE7E0|nr:MULTISPECIES: capsule biosynthesis protein CapA [Rhodobacterales]MDO6589110.1 capsule biosynthesis protein CapA [Yoonia sp. 1_MG-2023]RBW45455.1 capsule biosynthesis protein CapA [Loktanella sp. D2R18]